MFSSSPCLGAPKVCAWEDRYRIQKFILELLAVKMTTLYVKKIFFISFENAGRKKKDLYFSNDKEEKVFITTLLQIFFYYYSNKVCSKIKLIPFSDEFCEPFQFAFIQHEWHS
jgi:hypothetical protein